MTAIALKAESVSRRRPFHRALAAGPPRNLVEIAVASLDDGRAEDIVVIDLSGKSTMADGMIIASGRSARQVNALAENLVQRLGEAGVGPISVEGKALADWILIDAGDLIVHLFRPEIRAFYNLEKMWGVEGPVPGAEHAARPKPVLLS